MKNLKLLLNLCGEILHPHEKFLITWIHIKMRKTAGNVTTTFEFMLSWKCTKWEKCLIESACFYYYLFAVIVLPVTVTVGFPVLALIIIWPWNQLPPDPQTQLRVSHNLLLSATRHQKTTRHKSAIYHILLRNMLRYRREKSLEVELFN